MGIFSGLFKSRDKPQNRTSGSNYAFFFGGTTSGKAVTERSAMQMTAVYARYCALGNVIQISDEILLGDVLDYKKEVIDKRFGGNNRDAEYHLAFFRGGINAILKKWIENNCNESEEYIFNLLVNEYGIR